MALGVRFGETEADAHIRPLRRCRDVAPAKNLTDLARSYIVSHSTISRL
jgi:hypothetical protein